MKLKFTLLIVCLIVGAAQEFPAGAADSTFAEAAGAEPIRISGTVVDKEKNPLPGVTVVVKGTTIGASTGIDGHFYLNAPDKNSVLEVQYLGYKTQELRVGDDISFNVTLYEDAAELDEVVVVGYGNQKKMSVIGSIQT
ncbi:MAG: carboxypeptidase-like regulatory domain-containing protein, partial [Alistipes sp.]|nr:carboxypeptidase-like regulatory domain-containing protein [Alistipes sp.]